VADAVLGIDAGTGSLKAGLFGLDGASLGISRAAYAISSPEPDAREQDPRDWWSALSSTCRDLLEHAPPDTRVLSVAIGGQAPTLAPTDADLEPTHPAITWLDPRPSAEAERLYQRLGQAVPVWGSWPGQSAWFVHNRPEALGRTRWLFNCPDYLTSRLIGHPVALLAVTAEELEAAEMDGALFPPVWTPGTVVGEISQSAAAEIPLPAGTSVVAGHVDGLLGVLGSGVQQPGDACINAGTSGTFSVVCRPPLGYPMFGVNVAGSATNTSGAALDWFAEKIHPVSGSYSDLAAENVHPIGGSDTDLLAERLHSAGSAYSDLLASVASVPPGSDGLLFLPHLAGDRGATADAYARGAWVGLTLGHDHRHLLRALLEGVAFSFRSMQDWLEDSGAPVGDVRCIGGQARSDVWNQIKADVLQRPLLIPQVVEAAVAGAAILAALGIGAYPDVWQAAQGMVHIHRQFEPDPARVSLYTDLLQTYRSLYPALRETNWRLHEHVYRYR
jgi:xylulokinase